MSMELCTPEVVSINYKVYTNKWK